MLCLQSREHWTLILSINLNWLIFSSAKWCRIWYFAQCIWIYLANNKTYLFHCHKASFSKLIDLLKIIGRFNDASTLQHLMDLSRSSSLSSSFAWSLRVFRMDGCSLYRVHKCNSISSPPNALISREKRFRETFISKS